MQNPQYLKPFLEKVFQKYHQPDYLRTDPLGLVHGFHNPLDQEVVALLSALLAYGRVASIRKIVNQILTLMLLETSSPREWVQNLAQPRFYKRALRQFSALQYRFNSGEDIFSILVLLHKSWTKYGCLGAHFHALVKPKGDIRIPLEALLQEWIHALPSSISYQNVEYFLTLPSRNSTCKRWLMFLRWMLRSDQLDLGLWTQGSPLHQTYFKNRTPLKANALVIPLDTHTGRISRFLGLTSKKSLHFSTAIQITDTLKLLDPEDPTRYDFALCRLGIVEGCQNHFKEAICRSCLLRPVCIFAQEHYSHGS